MNLEDKRDILKDEKPFTWQILKEEKARIFWKNRPIKTIKGRDFVKLENLVAGGDSYSIQLFLARITGHFKH